MSKASFAGETGSKTVTQKFCHLFFAFLRAFFQSFCHKTLIISCLWSLVVALVWGSILQEWRKWSGEKNSVSIGRNMSKKGVGSKCALCLHRVIYNMGCIKKTSNQTKKIKITFR